MDDKRQTREKNRKSQMELRNNLGSEQRGPGFGNLQRQQLAILTPQ